MKQEDDIDNAVLNSAKSLTPLSMKAAIGANLWRHSYVRVLHDWRGLCLANVNAHRHKAGFRRDRQLTQVVPTAKIYRKDNVLFSAYVADSWFTRLKGLFGVPALGISEALIISPCSAVHSVGLKDAIDVAFIDNNGLILKCVELKPYSIARCGGAYSVVEMTSGTLCRHNISVHQMLRVVTTHHRSPGFGNANRQKHDAPSQSNNQYVPCADRAVSGRSR